MKIQTMSLVVGGDSCNASCPYCVSRMTGLTCKNKEPKTVNIRNLELAGNLAKAGGVTTIMMTGKGEPSLYPDFISFYLDVLKKYNFTFFELQTNAILFQDEEYRQKFLERWYENGLTTISISVASYVSEFNRKIFLPNSESYIDLEQVIASLHELGFLVRLNCTMMKGAVGDYDEVLHFVNFAKKNNVKQISIRPLRTPSKSEDAKVYEWAAQHELSSNQITNIRKATANHNPKLMSLAHDAEVFDIDGVGVCVTDCLTRRPDEEELRQIIYYPDGTVKYDWEFEGAILLPKGIAKYDVNVKELIQGINND